jgi:ACS family allantoate permease-like MFS transporter
MIEALTDPKTWLFALFSALNNVSNSLTNQQSLIIASFGFSVLQTTLLSCVPGVLEIFTIFTGVQLAARWPNSRAYVGAMYFVPSWIGILLLNLLPWSNQVCGFPSANLPSCFLNHISHDIRLDFLSASSWVRAMFMVSFCAHRSVAETSTPGFVLSLSWLNNVTAGHTKRVGTLPVIEVNPYLSEHQPTGCY